MKKLAVIVLALLFAAVPAFAGPGSDAVKKANDKISDLLKKQAPAAQVTDSVRDLLDIDELGKHAMVDQWSKLKPEQQKKFLETLRALIEENYAHGMKTNLTYTVTYTGESTNPDGDLVVTTKVEAPRKNGRTLTIKIDYVLKKDASGKLKAWDVKTDGVGLVENYRTQFNKIVEKDGFDALIGKMNKKRDEIKDTKEPKTEPKM
jgi:phospholipid transport system substrate-binding protein